MLFLRKTRNVAEYNDHWEELICAVHKVPPLFGWYDDYPNHKEQRLTSFIVKELKILTNRICSKVSQLAQLKNHVAK